MRTAQNYPSQTLAALLFFATTLCNASSQTADPRHHILRKTRSEKSGSSKSDLPLKSSQTNVAAVATSRPQAPHQSGTAKSLTPEEWSHLNRLLDRPSDVFGAQTPGGQYRQAGGTSIVVNQDVGDASQQTIKKFAEGFMRTFSSSAGGPTEVLINDSKMNPRFKFLDTNQDGKADEAYKYDSTRCRWIRER